MLRIDETSKTLAATEPPTFAAEPAPARDELLALLSSGWELFAAEIGLPHLRFLTAAPAEGVDLLAFDETDGGVAVVVVADALTPATLGRALAGAAAAAGWDAARLADVHEDLEAAVPHESPRLVLVAGEAGDAALETVDFLARRHGLEVAAHLVRTLRFGSERLMDVVRAYPAPESPSEAATLAPGQSAPPPGVAA